MADSSYAALGRLPRPAPAGHGRDPPAPRRRAVPTPRPAPRPAAAPPPATPPPPPRPRPPARARPGAPASKGRGCRPSRRSPWIRTRSGPRLLSRIGTGLASGGWNSSPSSGPRPGGPHTRTQRQGATGVRPAGRAVLSRWLAEASAVRRTSSASADRTDGGPPCGGLAPFTIQPNGRDNQQYRHRAQESPSGPGAAQAPPGRPLHPGRQKLDPDPVLRPLRAAHRRGASGRPWSRPRARLRGARAPE